MKSTCLFEILFVPNDHLRIKNQMQKESHQEQARLKMAWMTISGNDLISKAGNRSNQVFACF